MLYVSNVPGDLVLLTWRPDGNSPAMGLVASAYSEIADALHDAQAVPIQERIFCSLPDAPAVLEARGISPAGQWPVPPSVLEGAPCEGSGPAGIHIVGVRPGAGQRPAVVSYGNSPCGLEVAGNDAWYLALSDVSKLLPGNTHLGPAEEAKAAIHLAETLLTTRDWSFEHVRRTWFFLNDILDWYDEFNLVRNLEYERMGLSGAETRESLPASTGILADNPRGNWCVLDLLAVRSLNGHVLPVRRLYNPHQNEAQEYGSAFSRGLELKTAACTYLFISGTAAINNQGSSVHVDDFVSQTERTLDTVGALLEVGGAGLDDICQGTAFVKRRSDMPKLEEILVRRGLDRLPIVFTVGDVCREELLFELDATAVVAHHEE